MHRLVAFGGVSNSDLFNCDFNFYHSIFYIQASENCKNNIIYFLHKWECIYIFFVANYNHLAMLRGKCIQSS